VADFSFYTQLLADQKMTVALTATALLLAAFALLKAFRPWRTHLRGKIILTANEKEFFYRLLRALPGYHIFPRVSFSAIVTLDHTLSRKQRFSLRRRFAWKYADFVVCERGTLRILAIIELDDRSHDRQRDAIIAAAGYQTLRFSSGRKPSESEIAALFPGSSASVKRHRA
jgi:hypothetical protein